MLISDWSSDVCSSDLPAAVGSPLQAMIAIRLTVHSRDQIDAFVATASRLRGVLSIFHVAGATDYLLHVAFAGAEELRDFVLSELTAHPAVLHAETSLILDRKRGVEGKQLSVQV